MISFNDKRLRIIRECRDNNIFFIEKILGCLTLIGFQKNLAKLIHEYSKIAIRACHSVGKTFLMARIALWFLFCFKGAKVITTAPTYRQVVKLLWGEIRKAKKNSKVMLGGKVNLAEIQIDDDWYAIGFSPQDKAGDGLEQKSSVFQGFHARYLLIIFDEACGISADVFNMAEGLMSSGTVVKWICIGNPTSRSTMFFKLFSKADWKNIKISCFDSPNMIANGFTDIHKVEEELAILKCMNDDARLKRIENYKKPNPDMLTAQWAIAKFYGWGVDHPLTLSKVLAEFPDTDDYAIVQFENVQKAIDRELKIDKKETRYIGVDVARLGSASTVFTEFIGYKQVSIEIHAKMDNVEGAGLLTKLCNSNAHHEVVVLIDATGVGSGVVDTMKENKRIGAFKNLPRITIVGVHFNQVIELDDKEKEKEARKTYDSLKAFMFAKLDDDLRDNIDLMDEEIYEGQLPMIRQGLSGKGKVTIEQKDDFEKRTGLPSPDESDSLALANIARHLSLTPGKFKKNQEKTSFRKTFEEGKSKFKSRKLQKKLKITEY